MQPHLQGSLSSEGNEEIHSQHQEVGLGPKAVESAPSMEEGVGVTLAEKGQLVQAVRVWPPCSKPEGHSHVTCRCLVWQELRTRRRQWGGRAYVITSLRCHIKEVVFAQWLSGDL